MLADTYYITIYQDTRSCPKNDCNRDSQIPYYITAGQCSCFHTNVCNLHPEQVPIWAEITSQLCLSAHGCLPRRLWYCFMIIIHRVLLTLNVTSRASIFRRTATSDHAPNIRAGATIHTHIFTGQTYAAVRSSRV